MPIPIDIGVGASIAEHSTIRAGEASDPSFGIYAHTDGCVGGFSWQVDAYSFLPVITGLGWCGNVGPAVKGRGGFTMQFDGNDTPAVGVWWRLSLGEFPIGRASPYSLSFGVLSVSAPDFIESDMVADLGASFVFSHASLPISLHVGVLSKQYASIGKEWELVAITTLGLEYRFVLEPS